ncbi:DNAase [Comamonas serinivorans]|uniref:DNAase n=1 Tax=Comamonas serinivorans TaxID=1082851 RepID=A0A1Y0EMX4_9BURK|nr:TatD family hydrolase [Comamonas serinivorans]ARU04936.1 DNAase [Comamonas serinivorans]
MFTDSHCHLTYPGLVENHAAVFAAMQAAQVDRALCICTTMEEFEQVHALALAQDFIWASVGVHPDTEDMAEPSVADLVARAALPRVVAIGETGLDYYQMETRKGGRSIADLGWQRERFSVHIEAARRTDLPLVIHERDASADTLAMLRSEGQGGGGTEARGVFHCFADTREVARAALDLGFYVSFSGIVTFKSAKELQEVAQFVPDDRLLIETDSPYLAPVPFRGKTNTPALVPHVAAKLAELRGASVEAIAATTAQNFNHLFSKACA